MLVLHELDDPSSNIVLDISSSDWFVTHAYNGFDKLEFELPVNSDYYAIVHEECKVTFIGSRSRDMRFIVKNVDEHSDFVTVDCSIDLDDWQASIIKSFRTTNSTLDEVLDKILPVGWSKSGAEKFTKRTTVEANEGEPIKACTPLAVLDHVTEAYGCIFNFDNIGKVIYVINPDSEVASGEYVSDELNLSSRPGFVGNSSNFATRLYAYGKVDEATKEPLTFASINGGKEYVEDFKYSDKVVCIGWSDERYTVKENLLADAKRKLAEVSKPVRSYSCKVEQLNYNVWMYRVVVLLDTVRGIRVNHQVVEWKEHANIAEDEVSLSAVQPTIESLVQRSLKMDPTELIKQASNAYTDAIKRATDLITGSYGGYFKWIFDADGNPMELVNLADSTDINKAKQVWRWNKSGLGHSNSGYNGSYDLALLNDGSINATMMTVGIIQGGNSYWNLNTGNLSLYGEFRAKFKDDATGITQTIHIDPDATTSLISDPNTVFRGPAILFESSDQYRYGMIHSYTRQKYNGQNVYTPSSIEVLGGVKYSDSPGGYGVFGSTVNTSNGKTFGDSFIMATSNYLAGSRYRADVWTNAYEDHTRIDAGLSASDPNGQVGVQARIDTGYLYLGGYLGGFASGRATFQKCYWTSAQTTREYAYTRFTVTCDTPAKYGLYRPFCTIDSYLDNSKYIIGTTSNAGASGWNVWTETFPKQVITSISATWGTATISGVFDICTNLDMHWNSSNLYSNFTYLLYTIGVLGNV